MDNQNMPRVTELLRYEPIVAPMGYDHIPEMAERPTGEYVKLADVLDLLTRQAAPEAPTDDLDALVREYGNAPVTGPGRTRRIVMQEIYHAAGAIFAATTASASIDLDNLIADLPAYAPDRSGLNMEPHSDGIYVLRSDVQEVISSTPALSRGAAQPIKTWQERMPEHVRQIGTAASESPYKDAEIADLRAALARAPLPTCIVEQVKTMQKQIEGERDLQVKCALIDVMNELRAALAPLPAKGDRPIARLQAEVSDRPFSKGETFYEVVILDRARCFDGMELFAAPAQAGDARDAARYRVLRQNVAPRDVSIIMDIAPQDIPTDQSPAERIDMLCDRFIERAAMSASQDKKGPQ